MSRVKIDGQGRLILFEAFLKRWHISSTTEQKEVLSLLIAGE
jgi:hypothetical protein